GERILCCQDSAFYIQTVINGMLKTDLNYLFPVLVRGKSRYAGMRIKLIFKAMPTRAPPISSTTTTTETTLTENEAEDEIAPDAPPQETEDLVNREETQTYVEHGQANQEETQTNVEENQANAANQNQDIAKEKEDEATKLLKSDEHNPDIAQKMEETV
ncbi:hypothetical protein PFISCL1PPCAC_11062, partial [Pristionchus fissidentatus]